jgi:hypothetical protein
MFGRRWDSAINGSRNRDRPELRSRQYVGDCNSIILLKPRRPREVEYNPKLDGNSTPLEDLCSNS